MEDTLGSNYNALEPLIVSLFMTVPWLIIGLVECIKDKMKDNNHAHLSDKS